MSAPFIITCPHCFSQVVIEEINCRIFRHAVYRSSGEQMSPHAPKEECDEAIRSGSVYGCAGPFRIDLSGNQWITSICHYV